MSKEITEVLQSMNERITELEQNQKDIEKVLVQLTKASLHQTIDWLLNNTVPSEDREKTIVELKEQLAILSEVN